MKLIEVGTGYTSIPASMGAATEIVVEELSKVFEKDNINYEIFDIKDEDRIKTNLKIKEVNVPKMFRKKDTTLGIMHKLKRVVYSLSLAKALRKEIKNSDEDIAIHFHNQYNMFFFLKTTSKKMREKVKIYYTVHSYIWNNKWNNIEHTIKRKYFQEVYSMQNANKIFVLNNITEKHLIEHLGITKNKIIHMDNGVNTDCFKPLVNSQDDFIFLQTGSICERKNQLGAIKNLKHILKENMNCKYFYAGGIVDNLYQDRIKQYIERNQLNEKVEYLGELKPGKELVDYYTKAKAFIFPSTAEAFSLVILEAMACALPVIMNKKTILEVPQDLENVILFYEDEKSFDDIINNKILNEIERKKIAMLSRKITEEKYSWNIIAYKYLKEFGSEK